MTSRVRSCLSAVAVLMTLTAPPAAHAETVTVRDAVGDVEAFYFNEDQDTLPAPHQAASDITRTVTVYRFGGPDYACERASSFLASAMSTKLHSRRNRRTK